MNDFTPSANCLICGGTLTYLPNSKPYKCFYCGKEENGNITCSSGETHYICDKCHNKHPVKKIKDFIFSTKLKNPFQIADEILKDRDIPMLGCHHCYIVTGAIFASLNNSGLIGIPRDLIEEAMSRLSKQAIGGYCGLSGVCGIVPAGGVVYACLLDSVCGSDVPQKMTMELTSALAKDIYELTGPSCCKAYMYKAIETINEFFIKDFKKNPVSNPVFIKCNFSESHPNECRKDLCPYYKGLTYTPSSH